jgi:23S rRNA pseudouridine1911/1915/1917 synthase
MGDGKVKKLNILYEDNHIIVVVKEPNIPVQEDASKDVDLLTMIKEYVKDKYNKPGNVYIGLVHRLDRPVGGVMVFTRSSKAASRLCNQIRLNDFDKRYMALVHGKMENSSGTLKDYLLKDESTNTSKVVKKGLGKEAILDYKILNYDKNKNMSLLEVNLHTGRHHQIRVQLSHIKHPIYGDQRYGNDEVGIQIHLWAYKLTFAHPVTKEVMTFENVPMWAKSEE